MMTQEQAEILVQHMGRQMTEVCEGAAKAIAAMADTLAPRMRDWAEGFSRAAQHIADQTIIDPPGRSE